MAWVMTQEMIIEREPSQDSRLETACLRWHGLDSVGWETVRDGGEGKE